MSPSALCCVLSYFSCVWLFVTLWTVACHASPFMGFSRQEHWSGLPFPPPGNLPDPGTELLSPVSPLLQADCLTLEPSGKPSVRARRQNCRWGEDSRGAKEGRDATFHQALTLPKQSWDNLNIQHKEGRWWPIHTMECYPSMATNKW